MPLPPHDAASSARQPHRGPPSSRRTARSAVRAPDACRPADRRDVDDASPLARQHVAARRLREQKRAGQVDVDDLLPLLERHRFGLGRPGHAGVVDQDVHLAETAMVLSTTACTSSASRRRSSMPSTRNPRACIAATVGVSHSSRRAHSISAAPASGEALPPFPVRIPRDPPVTMATRSVSENNSLRVGTLSGLYFRAAGLSTDEHIHRRR